MNRIQKLILMKSGYIFILKNKLYFLEQFQVHRKTEWEVQSIPMCPLLPHMHRTLLQSTSHITVVHLLQWMSYTDTPLSLKSIVYITITRCFTFYEFGQVYNYICLLLKYHTEYISYIALKILCTPPIHSCLSSDHWKQLIFLPSP